ncbi:FIST signal transduction protein [Candidatus Symbiobacter mobilis]|uniref:FIST domain protein n=1 Tax=Candidatus Symbiobacter mobilis CR TaxID=946483 RepID=U5NBI2_9BURK|nr:FIST N-terminal domain-containing protein [Candidatus Symbiobacter mobilis]AGX87534.1 hypothetical protein Cenrod_1448 [Candidatus Symbiobacter mobilis CR]
MIKIASSKNPETLAALQEIATALQGITPTLVVVFYSSHHAAQQVADQARKVWPQSQSLGCSTSGEIISQEMMDGGMVAMAFDAATIPEARVAVVDDIGDAAKIKSVCQSLGDVLHADIDQYIGLVLMDGMSGKEEFFLDHLGNLTDLRFIGGSAGDDLAFQATTVFANGVVYDHAALLAVLHAPAGIRVIKTQSFCKTGKTLTPTQVDASGRQVLQFDGKPAGCAYMEAVGASSLEEAAKRFMSSPLGLMDGEEPYVRSPQTFDNETLKFYCAVSPDIPLDLLQSTDILTDTRNALATTNADGKVAGILLFHCILRTLELKSLNKTAEFSGLFTVPTVGFSTYGEADIGHINQTATMIAFLE